MQKLMLEILDGRKTNRVPFWFMRQAGRYLPEYRELRKDAGSFLDLCYNPKQACEVTIQPIRRFDMDAAILFSDILVIPHALGQELDFVPGIGPKLNPIKNEADFAKLDLNNISKILNSIYETIDLVKPELPNHTSFIGFAGAPWTVACYMVEGSGSKTFENVKKMAYLNEDLFQKIIDLLVESTSQYLIKQLETGVDLVQIFDSWAGLLSEAQFRKWSIEPTRQIVEKVREIYPDAKIIGFPKGANLLVPEYIEKTGVNAVGIDTTMPIGWAKQNINVPVQGNLDNVLLLAGGDKMLDGAKYILDNFRDTPFVFNLGHGVIKETNPDNMAKLCDFIRNYK